MANTTISFSRDKIGQLDKRFRTNLINSFTGFKSVSLIGTINQEGLTNLAVFSQVIHVGADPPLLGVLFRPHTVPRHTLENILDTQAFTLNHIQSQFLPQAHHSSARWDDSEFTACGLTPEYRNSPAPYVGEATTKASLSYVEHYTLRCNETVFLVGEIQELLIDDGSLMDDGFIDLVAAGTMTVSGLDAYHQVLPPVRLEYAKPDREVTEKD